MGFSVVREIPVKPPSGRVWGEIDTPKGLLGTIETLPLAKKLGNLVGDQSLHKVMFFRPPFGAPKGAADLLGPRCGFGAPKSGVGAPKIGSRVNHFKVAY